MKHSLNFGLIGTVYLLIFGNFHDTYGQNKEDKSSSEFSISLEYRPRAELRYGYRQLPSDTATAAFFISHRARLNMDYSIKKFKFHTSLQDIRFWGEEDTRDAKGEAQFYEFYVEPELTKNLSVRVGRQRIAYDNQRLFAENNWRQAGGQHDAVRLMYRNTSLSMDLIGAFNQNKANLFGTPYLISWDFYKVLVAHFFSYKINESLTLKGINFTDGYEDPDNSKTTHFKYINGGRITYSLDKFTFNFAGYYQHGKIETGESLSAFYLEPEIKWAHHNYTVRLGSQIFSGDNNPSDGKSTAFLAQYGAFHRFNGRMDYTQKTVRTYNHEGIVNPYLIQDLELAKFNISWESHLLATQKNIEFRNYNNKPERKGHYYGWENDVRAIYKPNSYTAIELSYMFMIPHKNLEYLPPGTDGNIDNIPQFAYVQVTWTPELFNSKNLH